MTTATHAPSTGRGCAGAETRCGLAARLLDESKNRCVARQESPLFMPFAYHLLTAIGFSTRSTKLRLADMRSARDFPRTGRTLIVRSVAARLGTKIIGIAGSLRKASFNAALLRAAAELAPAGTEVEIASIATIPLYDGDLERERGIPEPVTMLKDRIAGADGLLIVTPEYNSSIPGVLKNAIDWLTRPHKDIPEVFGDKPVAVMGTTPGMGGTRLSQAAWLPVLRTLGTRPWFGKQLYVAGANQVFGAESRLIDEKIKKLLAEFMAGFSNFVDENRSSRVR